jgi:hypothetical protein
VLPAMRLTARDDRASRASAERIRVDARRTKNRIVEAFQVMSTTIVATVKSIEMPSRSSRVVAGDARKESDKAIGIVYGVQRACAVN